MVNWSSVSIMAEGLGDEGQVRRHAVERFIGEVKALADVYRGQETKGTANKVGPHSAIRHPVLFHYSLFLALCHLSSPFAVYFWCGDSLAASNFISPS